MPKYMKDSNAYQELIKTDLYEQFQRASWPERHHILKKLDENLDSYGEQGKLLLSAVGEDKFPLLRSMTKDKSPTTTFGAEVRTLEGLVSQAHEILYFDLADVFVKPGNQ